MKYRRRAVPLARRYHAPMRRKLFTLAAAVSLALFVATVVVWVRSYWREDRLSLYLDSEPMRYYRLNSDCGVVRFESHRYVPGARWPGSG